MTQATLNVVDPIGDDERLRVEDNRGLTVEFLTPTPVRIRGTALASVYQAILQSVTYENAEKTPNESDRRVSVPVTETPTGQGPR